MTVGSSEPPDGRGQSLIGQRFGVYDVLSLIGVGGMGEVYRAHDSRLGRDVAIKVLPPAVATDPDRLRRFEREARVLATLNHPNIGAIYGAEDVGGAPALVLELVEGETLSDRLRRGPLPPSEARAFARQLADALDAAHERGIIHRDLKPANVKVTPDGVLKVLDFGLARAVAVEEHTESTESPTLTSPATRVGTILGTAAYMSPEQARGRTLDKRTDIWSFGCVLFEMVTARPAFGGETVSDTIAVILKGEPDWSAVPAQTPIGIRRLLRRCLEKDRGRRLRDIGDSHIDLEDLSTDRVVTSDRWLRPALGALALLLFIALASLAMLLGRSDRPVPADQLVRRFSLDLGFVRPVISPDGRRIAYRSDGRLWIRDIDSEVPREIPGGAADGGYYSDTGYYLTWSPDSHDLAFPAEGELRRVSAQEGGAATTICKLPAGRATGRQIAGMAWSRDGETIVFSRYGAGIYEVSARGGSPVLIAEAAHADDVLLFETAEGRAIVFAESATAHDLVVRTPTGERRVIGQVESSWPELAYSPSGHILFRRDPAESPSIWALPFSASTLTAAGEPFVVERSGLGMSVSDDGTLVYLDIGRVRGQRLAWRDRAGAIVTQSAQTHELIQNVSLSPDGSRAVVTAQDGSPGMWLYDVQRFARTRVDLGPMAPGANAIAPFFSRTGAEIYYTVLESPTKSSVFAKPADGFAPPRAVPAPEGFDGFHVAQGVTADQRGLLVIGQPTPAKIPNMWLWRSAATGGQKEAIHFSQNTEREIAAALSPNGRFVAYTSPISGRLEVYVRPFPEGSERWQISVNGGASPAWRPDGSELFYRELNTLMRVGVSTSGAFSSSVPEPLFEHPSLGTPVAPVARYAVAADGQQILTVDSDRDRATPVVRFAQHRLRALGHPEP